MFRHPGTIALIFLVLGIVIYFAFDIVPANITSNKELQQNEKEAGSPKTDELVNLSAVQKAELDQLNKELESTGTESGKSEVWKKISAFWFKSGDFLQSGNAAVQVASIENTSNAWGIAGTSYLSGIKEGQEESSKLACRNEAIKSFDKAISLDSINPQHQMNKALCYVKQPDENPMQGIMLLLELNKKYPDYIPVQVTLSQLAIQTGQWDKAYDRLKKILKADPQQAEANCLMIEVIEQSKRNEDTKPYQRFCKE